MAINFSKRFVDIYLDSGNQEMRDVMQKTMSHVERIQASDEDKEFIFESLYAFKMIVADPRGIDMDEIYNKLQYINSISHTDISNSNWAGVCCSESDGVRIVIDDSKNVTEDDKKRTLSHELIHAYSVFVDVNTVNGEYIYSSRINGFADESATEALNMKVMRFLGAQYSDYDVRVEDRANDFISNAETSFVSTGYSKIVSYSDIIDKAFGPEFYYNKLQVSNITENLEDDNAFRRVSRLIDGIQEKGALDTRLELEHVLLDKFENRYSNFDLSQLDTYMYEMKLFNKVEVRFNMENDSPSYQPDKIHSAAEYQTAFEIKNIYAKINGITSTSDIISEMNPATRSDDCYNFLVGMAALKQIKMPYSSEDIENMRCTKNGSLYKLSIGGDSYIVDAKIDKDTGMVGLTTVKDSKELSFFDKMDSWSAMIGSSKTETDIDYIKMVGVDEVSGIYTKTSRMIMNSIADVDDKTVILSFAASSIGSVDVLKERLKDVDITEITDSHGNNIMHVLATNQSFWAREMTETLAKMYPEEVEKLVNQPNEIGETPGDVMRVLSNVNLLTVLSDNYINNESKEEFRGVTFDAVKLEYVDTIKSLIEEKDFSTIRLLISEGKASSIIDSEGNNVLHMYAKGELPLVSVSKVLNSGVDIHDSNYGQLTPLKQAVASGNVDAVKMLMKFDEDHEQAIVSCAWKMQFSVKFANNEKFAYPDGMEIFDALTKNGYNPNATDFGGGVSLLQIAAGINRDGLREEKASINYELVNRLLHDGADPFYSSSDKYKSLRDFAAQNGDVKLFKMMVSTGADKDMLDVENSNLSPAEKALITAMADVRDNDISKDNIKQSSVIDENLQNIDKTEDKHIEQENSKSSEDDVGFGVDD